MLFSSLCLSFKLLIATRQGPRCWIFALIIAPRNRFPLNYNLDLTFPCEVILTAISFSLASRGARHYTRSPIHEFSLSPFFLLCHSFPSSFPYTYESTPSFFHLHPPDFPALLSGSRVILLEPSTGLGKSLLYGREAEVWTEGTELGVAGSLLVLAIGLVGVELDIRREEGRERSE